MASSPGEPLVSIIIPCKKIDEYVLQCINRCRRMNYKNLEIIILPDEYNEEDNRKLAGIEGVTIVPTGPITPGAKRNIGIKLSKGEICAFIDSDAYPHENWIKNALKYLKDEKVAAIGGPGLTPPEDSPMQKASGYVYAAAAFPSSLIGRYRTHKPKESDDIHSCNFIAKKSVLQAVGGWNEKYWPGEDTLLCLAIAKAGYKMLEAPDVIVYHHRKPLFRKHLRQVIRFALHRGHFARKYGGNSRKPQYLAPSTIVATLFGGAIASLLLGGLTTKLYLLALAVYLTAALIASIAVTKERKLIPLVWIGVILTHLVYGIHFIVGFLKQDLKR